MTTQNASITDELAQIQARYDAYFAGQPRMSRQAEFLDEMVTQLNAMSTTDAALTTQIAEAKALYLKEATTIRQAQAGGPDAFAAHRLSSWANLAFARYRHHFAGHSRSGRDMGLLGEMIAELEDLDAEMAELEARFKTSELTSTRETLTKNLDLYRSERRAIGEARGVGSLQEQSDLLAQVANDQFAIYGAQFANKSRLSRRPMLLDRIVENLKALSERMNALKSQGLISASNDGNIDVVAGRIKAYEQEMSAIQQARAGTDFPSLINALGQAANEIFEEYRKGFAGQDRATRELPKMVTLLDALYDIGRQMDDLSQVRKDDTNDRNLQIVTDHLRLYDREFDNIRQAQATTDA
jgi:hypothetical protein